ncbi:hypothetical protein DPMN_159718 [Dreissena polymorpha]|uniref:FLYWCH-type domain-containing protein n=1 Tax=Dreissena polymorpha TaxID=45954 RepID=A0A9D4ENT5_DREPO|nr:hypothetical protein DPMN_159718 [Dreissena polymorpha]
MDYSSVESVRDTSESDAMDYSSVRDVDSTDTDNADQLNQPFDLPDRPAINQDSETVETDIGDESLSTTAIEEQTVTFEVIEIGSKRGKPLLVGSDGFRYYVKKTQKNSVLWACSLRSSKCPCYATMIQKGTDFVRGPNNHQHGPEASIDKKIRIGVKVKEEAKAQP